MSTILKRASLLVALTLVCGTIAFAQTGPIEGTVKMKNADGTMKPVEGATVLIRRTDIKGEWTIKTDKAGRYVRLGMPLGGTFLVVVSGPGIKPTYLNNIRLTQTPTVDFVAEPGDGSTITAEQVMELMKKPAGGGAPQQPQVSEADRAKAMKDKEEYDKAVKESQALQGTFDAARTRYNTGIEMMKTRSYTTAVSEFEAAAGIDSSKHVAMLEIAYKANANLAEAHYQLGVDKFNNKQRNEAKPHFESAVKAAVKALDLAATNTKDPNINNDLITYYGIYGKNALLLIEHYGQADLVPQSAQYFDKAAALDTVNKNKWLVMKGDAYRASSMADEAVAAYKSVIDVDPKNFDALFKMGLTYLASAEKEKLQQAANYLDAFIAAAPPTDGRVAEAKSSLQVLKNDFKVEAEKPARRGTRKP